MDRIPIYLESDDEITSVVDKLKNAEGTSLDIVIPKEAIMLQSVINLKLLKKQAESLGKEITIVTTDKVGQKLAEQIGIPVVAREGQEPKEVIMSEVEKPTFSEDDIKIKNVQEVANVPVVPDDEGVQKAGDAQNAESVQDAEAKPKEAKKKGWFRLHKKGIAVAIGFGILALAILAYVFVPLANITIRLAAEKKSLDLSFTADKAATEVSTDENKIPAREVVQELEKEETYPATGKKDIGEKATGQVTIYNNFSTTSKTLVAGTKLVSNGLNYTITTNVTVPGYTDPGGGKVAGKIENVNIRASEAGEKYNIASGSKFSVPIIGSNDFYAEATTALTGGTTKQVTYITAQDIASAEEKLATTVDSELKTKLNDAIEDGDTLLEEAFAIEKQAPVPSSPVNTEVSEFKLKVSAKITALVFNRDDLLRLAEGVLSREIGSTKEIVEKDSLVSEAKLQKIDTKTGVIEATLAGEAYIASKINQDELRNSINGDPEAVASEFINGLEGVDEVQFRFFPGFYKRIPRINSHIYFKVEINKTQASGE